MTDRATTRERILEAARRLFNEKGYAATTVAEIAASIGISQGNLTYHFPTKRDLVTELERRHLRSVGEQRARHRKGPVTDDYVDLLLFAMNNVAQNRFLLLDRAQFARDEDESGPDPHIAADLEALHERLRRAKKEGLFRRDMPVDLKVLARSLWIVSRYWMDHLREFEGVEQPTWEDLQRGLQHHFAVLLPYLTSTARRDLESAVFRVSSRFAASEGLSST